VPEPVNVAKAVLSEIWWDPQFVELSQPPAGDHTAKSFEVQFNPQTLKLSYSVQTSGGDGGKKDSSTQYTARGSTKLSLELWFDVALAVAQGRVLKGSGDQKADVRVLTQEVAYFLTPQKANLNNKDIQAPPGVKFKWGNFEFKGVMESMDETIDHFSPDGLPLRASVSVSIVRQEITYKPSPLLSQSPTLGTQPLQAANLGQSLQQMAARAGISDWRSIATANNVDNPRQLGAGTLLNFST
jgi:hypothetical protein